LPNKNSNKNQTVKNIAIHSSPNQTTKPLITDKLKKIIKARQQMLYRGIITEKLGKPITIFFNKHFTNEYTYINEFVKSPLVFLKEISKAMKMMGFYKLYLDKKINIIDSFDLTKVYKKNLFSSSIHLFRG
jgi:hypothetical protein